MANLYQEYGAKLLANGYLIIPIKPGSKRPALSEWPESNLGAESLTKYPGCGIGVITGRGDAPICAIDIDIKHPELAYKFSAWCLAHLGTTVERVGDAPKILLPYRAAESDWKKQVSVTFEDATGYRGKVEFLGKGQQFVAYHIHPDTKEPYEWTDFIGGLTGLGADDLPVITLDQIEEAIEAFEQMALELGLKRVSGHKETVKPSAKVVQLEQKPVSEEDFFLRVNQAAIKNLSAWVPALFPTAREYNGGYRIAQEDLGRNLQEDLSISENGAVDFGVADMGDAKEGKRTPIDLVIEWSRPQLELEEISTTAFEAAQWLCNKLGVTREQLGYGLRRKREQDAEKIEKIEKKNEIEAIKQEIYAAADQDILIAEIAPRAGLLAVGNAAAYETLAGVIKQQFKTLANAPLSVGALRKAMRAGFPVDDGMVNGFHMTELGNAYRMIERYGKNIMYIPKMDQWFAWENTRWLDKTIKQIGDFAIDTVNEMSQDLVTIPETAEEKRGLFHKFCMDSQTNRMYNNMISIAEKTKDVSVDPSELDAVKHYFGVANGAIDLRTGELVPADPVHKITRITSIEFDPEAECPLFLETLSDAFYGKREYIETFELLMGYAMTGNPSEDIVVFLNGEGSNGKSTLLGALKHVFGDHAFMSPYQTFLGNQDVADGATPRSDLMSLQGRRFVWTGEPPEGTVLKSATIKAITGGEPIVARGVFKEHMIEIKPTWLLVIPVNEMPIIKGQDRGIWRRIVILPFTRNFSEDPKLRQDTRRDEKLEKEAAGILAWCVRACLKWQAHLDKYDKITLPECVLAQRDDYRQDMDIVGEWLAVCCEEVAEDEYVSCAALWASWEAYAKARGDLLAMSSASKLTRRLAQKYKDRVRRVMGARRVYGLRIKDDDLGGE